MKIVIILRFDGGVQPVLIVVDLDHDFVNRDMIRTLSIFGL